MDNRSLDEAHVAQLWSSLRNDLRRRGADAETAEDIAQDSWLVALRSPPDDRSRLRGWLRVVAIRLWRRSRAREDERWRRELPAARAERWDAESVVRGENGEPSLLRRYVDELSEPYRTALALRFFEGLEVAEIAERLSIKSATVHTHLRRGLARLRERIGRRPEERGRLWGICAWLAWLRGRMESRTAPVHLLGGAGLAATAVLSVWLLAEAAPRSAPTSALPREISALRDGRSTELVAFEAAPSASLARQQASAAPVPVLGARLEGIVRRPDGEPLPGARVHVADVGGAGAEQVTTADEKGRYEIPLEGQLLWASHPQWCDSARQYVAALRQRSQLDLVLLPTRGRAEVEVVSQAGLPVAGARVQIDAALSSQQVATSQGTLEFHGSFPVATTDERGRCWLSFPERVETELFVLPPDQPGWRGWLPTPAAGGSLRIQLPGPLVVMGTCSDEAGHPLWDAQVVVSQLAGLVQRQTRTASDGSFRIEGLAPGDFVLRAREAGPRRSSARHMGWLEPGEQQPLALELGERSSILGRVLDADGPVAGARVELEMWNVPAAEGTRRTERTDEQGLFAFAGCAPGLAHYIQIFLPGAAEPCIGAGLLRPGRGEVRYVVPAPDRELAPIELVFSGADAPDLIELRTDYPAISAILEPGEDGLGSFLSPPLPAGDYRVLAWHPVLGIWREHDLSHDPHRPRVHPFSWPATATLAIELELPQGMQRDEVEVALLVPGFHRNRLGLFGNGNARRVLDWSEPERAFVAALAPGTYPLLVRGGGLSEIHRTIELAPGAVHRLSLAPWPGVETTVFFESWAVEAAPRPGQSWGMKPNETVQLEALTPTGSTRLELIGRDLRRVEGGFEFTVWLPRTTLELSARTASTQFVDAYPPRAGRCVLEPGALEAAQGRPRIRIALASMPL